MLRKYWVTFMSNNIKCGGLFDGITPQECAKSIYLQCRGATEVKVYDPLSHYLVHETVSRGPATVYVIDFKNKRLIYKAVPEPQPSVA